MALFEFPNTNESAFVEQPLSRTSVKSLSLPELERLCHAWQDLIGARLQEIFAGDKELVLGLWHRGEMNWLWFDLNPRAPIVLRFASHLPEKPKKTKPLQLFLRAHAKNRHFSSLGRLTEVGRGLRLVFGAEESEDRCSMDAWLFPHGQNLVVEGEGGKVIYWTKPRALKAVDSNWDLSPGKVDSGPQDDRHWWENLSTSWLNERNSETKHASQGSRLDNVQLLIKKKRDLLARLQQELVAQDSSIWAQVGEWLKSQQELEVPFEWQAYIDPDKSLAENIENCFAQESRAERRRKGRQERCEQLAHEIHQLETSPESLEKGGTEIEGAHGQQRVVPPSKGAKTRRCDLGGGLEVYRGRSAKDNLNLLRQATPWTLWLHLRDYPGAYGFIRPERNHQVPYAALYKAARWLVQDTVGRKSPLGKYAVIWAECRFIRPIKGDRLGRVTVHNQKEIWVDLNENASC